MEERFGGKLLDAAFGPGTAEIFKRLGGAHRRVRYHYHAGFVASYLIRESVVYPRALKLPAVSLPPDPVITADTLFVTLSQS